ncbi:hypothetical protein PTE30175_02479 [Pandoraea terrae]|uniref:Uncharacterized protein n=1 Tax=Pandoraea terrae TaxID=1537710 RepID=A0A5E4VB58_9BURK|nr:hypothetical protein PTE30175_02479 [Pandoraea terrae]
MHMWSLPARCEAVMQIAVKRRVIFSISRQKNNLFVAGA